MFPMFGIVGAVALVSGAVRNDLRLKRVLKAHSSASQYLPKAISLLVVTAQLSELVRTVDNVSIVRITAALFLFAIVAATTQGQKSELL